MDFLPRIVLWRSELKFWRILKFVANQTVAAIDADRTIPFSAQIRSQVVIPPKHQIRSLASAILFARVSLLPHLSFLELP